MAVPGFDLDPGKCYRQLSPTLSSRLVEGEVPVSCAVSLPLLSAAPWNNFHLHLFFPCFSPHEVLENSPKWGGGGTLICAHGGDTVAGRESDLETHQTPKCLAGQCLFKKSRLSPSERCLFLILTLRLSPIWVLRPARGRPPGLHILLTATSASQPGFLHPPAPAPGPVPPALPSGPRLSRPPLMPPSSDEISRRRQSDHPTHSPTEPPQGNPSSFLGPISPSSVWLIPPHALSWQPQGRALSLTPPNLMGTHPPCQFQPVSHPPLA